MPTVLRWPKPDRQPNDDCFYRIVLLFGGGSSAQLAPVLQQSAFIGSWAESKVWSRPTNSFPASRATLIIALLISKSNPLIPLIFYHTEEVIPTAECTKSDLRKARESANLTRWQAGDALGVSQDTIKRWEDPKDSSKPTSADVSRMEDAYGSPGLWYAWMHSNDDGFRDRMAPPTAPDLRESIMKIFASMQDLIDDQAKILRDAADGYIDDKSMAEKILKLSADIASAGQSLSEEMKRQMEG